MEQSYKYHLPKNRYWVSNEWYEIPHDGVLCKVKTIRNIVEYSKALPDDKDICKTCKKISYEEYPIYPYFQI